jgi:hypothetical protein
VIQHFFEVKDDFEKHPRTMSNPAARGKTAALHHPPSVIDSPLLTDSFAAHFP